MGLALLLAKYITAFIATVGYPGVFLLMVMESMVFPVPSEAVMPFAGFLIVSQKFTFFGVIAVSTLASVVGSWLSYLIGMYGGRPFIDRFGKYFLLDHEDLNTTEKFFNKYGDITIFICRFIPVVRHLISIPAGIGEMNPIKFTLYTALGAGAWNAILTYAGFYLKQNWINLLKSKEIFDVLVVVFIIALVGYFFYKHIYKLYKK